MNLLQLALKQYKELEIAVGEQHDDENNANNYWRAISPLYHK